MNDRSLECRVVSFSLGDVEAFCSKEGRRREELDPEVEQRWWQTLPLYPVLPFGPGKLTQVSLSCAHSIVGADLRRPVGGSHYSTGQFAPLPQGDLLSHWIHW